MMKLIRLVVFLIGVIVISFIAFLFYKIIFETPNDYQEVIIDISHYDDSLLTDNFDKLNLEHSYRNLSGDLLSSFTYSDDIRLYLWELKSFQKLDIDSIIIQDKIVETESFTTYSQLSGTEAPNLIINSKLEIPISNKLFLGLDKGHIRETIIGGDYLLLNLAFDNMSIGTSENSNEIIIETRPWIESANVIFINRDEKLFVGIMYFLGEQKAVMSAELISKVFQID